MAEDMRLYVSFFDHPKTVKLLRRLHRHGAWGGWHLLRLLAWTTSNRPDGNLDGMSGEDIEIAAQWTLEPGVFAPALVDVGFLDVVEGGYRIHDWAIHQPWALERLKRQKDAKAKAEAMQSARSPEERSAGARKAANARWDKQRARRLALARSKGTASDEEREAMLRLCGHRCVQCKVGGVELELDHIVAIYNEKRPEASDAIENLQPLCRGCNASRGSDETDYRPANWRELLAAVLHSPKDASRMHDHASWTHDPASKTDLYANSQPSPTQPSKIPPKIKSNTNPNAPRIESRPSGLSQQERDTWDLRRFQDAMQRSAPQVGTYIADPDASWRNRARDAAFDAGLSPARILALLKQHYPDDPNVDLLYPRLVDEKAATA